ncbi:MAG: M28 family peptidase [Verrucomicrobiota bacterium]|nr:M28 family peptidase [Verrucomicrobiota bacterium]
MRNQDRLESLRRIIAGAYSGDRARRMVAQLHRNDRWITNPRYERSARACRQWMKRLGFDDVELLKFPIDGSRLYGNWKTPKHWTVRRAYLKLRIGNRWQTLADYARVPTSVFVYAAPTRSEVRTMLVPGECADTRGKLVFRSDGKADLLKLQDQGALGLVTDYAPNWPGVRTDRDFRDGHRWENGFLVEDDAGLAGFSLSRNQGVLVRRELEERGSIECRFRVDGRLGAGELFCVTGCLKGAEKPEEEVVAVAHLYETGANDNGSGVAGAIEALRVLRTLARRGLLKPPARTIRVIFTMEIVGFLAYFSRAAKPGARYVAGVNPDMIGEDHRKCRSILHIYRSPDSAATFADPLLIALVRRAAGDSFAHEIKGFMVNDNIISDPAIGVPCPALIHLRDRFYHSNEDTVDKVSPRTLKVVGGAMAAYLYAAASLDRNLAPEVARLCVRHAAERLRLAAEKKLLTRRLRDYLVTREQERVRSVEALTGADLGWARAGIRSLADRLKAKSEKRARLPAALAREARRLTPARTVIGPLTLQHMPLKVRARQKFLPAWSARLNLPLFWADGKRTLLEIYEACRCELVEPLDLAELIGYFRFLARQGLVRLRKTPRGRIGR